MPDFKPAKPRADNAASKRSAEPSLENHAQPLLALETQDEIREALSVYEPVFRFLLIGFVIASLRDRETTTVHALSPDAALDRAFIWMRVMEREVSESKTGIGTGR